MVKLTTACKSGDALTVLKALRASLAEKLETTESGRDYAAISKSFIDTQAKIQELEKSTRAENTHSNSPLAKARAND